MRRPSLVPGIAGAAVLATLSALLAPIAAHAVDVDQQQVVSATPSSTTPQVLDGQVSAMAAVGSDIVIGGTFTQVQNAGGGTTYARTGIAAFDATTGLVDTAFAPTLDGPVNALDANLGNVVVGGAFATVNGVAQRGVTELSLDGSRVAAFAGHIDGTSSLVDTLVVRSGLVYVGGRFTKAMGASRSALAVFNAGTGALTSFNVPVTGNFAPSTTPTVGTLDVSPAGTTLVIGGNFTVVGGQARSQLAIVDIATGKVTSWQTTRLTSPCSDPNVDTYVRSLAISPDGTYFVLVDGGGPLVGTLCDSASRWELGPVGTGQQPTWVDATGGDTLTAVATTGTAVYVGGHERWVNNYAGNNSQAPTAVDRKMVAALDPATGLPFSWDPGQTRGGTGVYDLLATTTGLWVGSDSDVAFGAGHDKLAFFPLAGGSTPPGVQPQTLPRNLFIATTAGGLTDRSYDGTTFGGLGTVASPGSVPWASVTGAFMLSGKVYYGTADGVLHKAPFDGSTVGSSSTVSTWWDLTGVKSFTIGSGRLFYVNGDGKLYYRWFSNESDVVGAEQVTVATTGYADAREMFVANNSLYFARADHKLYRVALSSAGVPTGSVVQVSGAGIDSIVWDGPAAFLSSNTLKPFTRLWGADRMATAIAVSKDEYSAGAAGAVVLARMDAFPDGLAGAPLAARVHGPLLLTPPGTLDPRVSAEIQRVLPHGGLVYELGGTVSIGTSVDTAVKALGYTTKRLSGSDRFGTSVAIANELATLSGGVTKALVVTGMDFPDALGAGAAAAVSNGAVLLTNGSVMPASVTSYLKAHPALQVWGIGGKGAAAAVPYITSPARSLIGSNRQETATKVATAFFTSPQDVIVVNYLNFPDGLSGGPYAAFRNGPILLSPQPALDPKDAAWMAANATTITQGHVLGGPLMISDATLTQAASAIS